MQEVQVDSSEKLTTSDSPVESPSLPSVLYVDEALGKSVISPDEDALDGGRGWIVVLGCFIFSAATWGWACVPAWGVTEEYFRTHMFPGTADSVLTALGSLSSMVLTLVGIVTGKLADRYGYKPLLAAGALLWIASMLASAFCTTIWQFFITMGLMQGIADALVFPAIVALPAQWFKRYQGLATGIVVAGSSVGGAIASLIYRELLSAVGLRKSLAIFTAIHVVLLSAAYLMIAERASPGDDERRQAGIVWFDAEFFRDPVFWSVAGCFFFVVFGYLGPVFLIPTFTAEKVPNLRELLAALPLVVLNLSAALGRTLVGFAADFFGPVNSLLVAITLSGLTQLVVWMFVSTYGGIMAFAILYGFFCGCFISLVSAVVVRIYGADKVAGLSGLLLLFNTPGYAAGAPIAGAILGATGNNWRVVAGYGGSVQIAGALCLVYARMKREPRIFAVY
ncbi:major facilitator superfamily domain-containing protein [Cubamyces menziesii]|nr:major facilitator superfamily domain-containing protein [Cubamyces menziesii]